MTTEAGESEAIGSVVRAAQLLTNLLASIEHRYNAWIIYVGSCAQVVFWLSVAPHSSGCNRHIYSSNFSQWWFSKTCGIISGFQKLSGYPRHLLRNRQARY
jgi:hypothetical protein